MLLYKLDITLLFEGTVTITFDHYILELLKCEHNCNTTWKETLTFGPDLYYKDSVDLHPWSSLFWSPMERQQCATLANEAKYSWVDNVS